MQIQRKNIDTKSVQWATDMAREIIDSETRDALNYANDPKKKERLEDCLCKVCFYRNSGSRIGGAAITSTACGICSKNMSFGNTNTDIVCRECALGAALCKHCGADISLRPRRKFEK